MEGDKKNKPTVKYTKSQLVASEKYSDNVDLLNALLNDNETYSIGEVDKKISTFMKGKVK